MLPSSLKRLPWDCTDSQPNALTDGQTAACRPAAVGVTLFMLEPLGSVGYLPPPPPKYRAERERPQTGQECAYEVADELPPRPPGQIKLDLLSGFSRSFYRLVQLTSCLGWLVLHAHAPRRFAACGHCARPGLRAASCAAQRCAVPHNGARHSSVAPRILPANRAYERQPCCLPAIHETKVLLSRDKYR